jgi:hypothetical protein
MKLVYLLILIVAICIVITYIFIRLENTRKEVIVLQQKFNNLNSLIENKQENKKNSPKKSDSFSLTSSVSEKSIGKKNIKNNSNNIFQSLGLPDLFSLFNNSSILNNINLKEQPNFENFIKHPNFINVEEISTSDEESEATSVILVQNEKKVNNDLDYDKTEAYIDNDKQIEVYSNSEKTQKSEDNLQNNNTQNEKQDSLTPSIAQSIPQENNIDLKINTEQLQNNNISEKIETNTETNTEINTKIYTKNYLETLKLNDLKEIAKKHKVNITTGKKLKNKTELINDLIKF